MTRSPDDPILFGPAVMLCILIVVLSLAGFLKALYFTFAYYGRIKKARWVPEILCAREGSSCVTVVQTRYVGVFGIPNSVLALAYYLLLIGWVLAGPRTAFGWAGRLTTLGFLAWALVAISAVTVILGFFLIYALRRKLHVDCQLCYTAHAINIVLFVLLMLLL